jgi:G:T-mismatch repair DNA endonuclease (very short patch repair protein)
VHRAYWRAKRTENLARDARVQRDLERRGWEVLTLWECELATAMDTSVRTIARAIAKAADE